MEIGDKGRSLAKCSTLTVITRAMNRYFNTIVIPIQSYYYSDITVTSLNSYYIINSNHKLL